MSTERFNVVVSGSVLEGFEPDAVKDAFTRLFKLDAAKTEQIFRRGNVAIKRDIDADKGQRFIDALQRIGVAAQLQPFNPAPEAAAVAPARGTISGAVSKAAAAARAEAGEPDSSGEVSQRGGEMAAMQESDAEGTATSAENASREAGEPAAHPFRFYGNGTEYFRIWIVNILLTIVTLGIYSAWAKVRNAQYFYGNTEVAGSRFAYHAKPLTILKGRIIAVVLFVAYSLISQLNPIAGLALALAILAVLPWIIVRSLKFNRRVTAWRNLRFGFDGEIWPAFKAFVFWPLAGVFSLGLLMPLALYKQQQFIVDNSRYGTEPFQLTPCGKAFYMIFVGAFGIFMVAFALMFGLNFLLPPLAPLVMLVAYLYVFAFISVRKTNLIFNNSALRGGDFDFSCDWSDGSYIKLMLVNTLLTLLTLGFYYPWAKVRVAQYKADHLQLNAHADLEGFIAGETENVSALGEEMGDVFDMEVGI
ncbi:YjgN family protein [Motiliproteus sediminis]|uniref:YjgN family protein n=1 Tax=Motiliproteus sediminis TaxID=1468178 RepID=UPI001AEFB6F8|nr:YjgN family protein [Motiliproteus sediminis]